MSFGVSVTPWPSYAESGRGLFWDVRVVSRRIKCTVVYAHHLGRFVVSGEIHRLRMKDASAYRNACRVMSEFCSKIEQTRVRFSGAGGDTPAGQYSNQAGHCDGTSSRAQEPSGWCPDVPGDTSAGTNRNGTGDISANVSTNVTALAERQQPAIGQSCKVTPHPGGVTAHDVESQCTRCGQAGHRASHCRWPACELPAAYYACEED